METDASSVPQFAADHAAKLARRALLASAGPVTQLLIGDAIGDAFGFGVEMQDAYWLRQKVTRLTSWPENPAKPEEHRFNSIRGMYSDDCEMTVGLMKAFLEHGMNVTEEAMLTAWRVEWELAKRRPLPAVPGAERSGHGSVKHFFRGRTTLEKLRESQASRVDPGNAPPMRALPLAFVDPERCQQLCLANADSTHPHPKARAASYVIAQAARWLIVERGKKSRVVEVALERLQSSDLNHAETAWLLQRIGELPDYHSFGQRLRRMPEDVHALLCGQQPHPDLEHVPGGQDGTSAVHGLGSDAMRTAGVVLYILRFHRGPRDALLTSPLHRRRRGLDCCSLLGDCGWFGWPAPGPAIWLALVLARRAGRRRIPSLRLLALRGLAQATPGPSFKSSGREELGKLRLHEAPRSGSQEAGQGQTALSSNGTCRKAHIIHFDSLTSALLQLYC